MRDEHAETSEMDLAGADGVDEDGKTLRRARHGDAVVGGVVGEAELIDAEGEHRGRRTFEVELACVDFSEVKEEIRLDDAGLAHESVRGGEEVGAAEFLERWIGHDDGIPAGSDTALPDQAAPRGSGRASSNLDQPPGGCVGTSRISRLVEVGTRPGAS